MRKWKDWKLKIMWRHEMWGCGSLALADARCQSRSVSYQSHVARCPPLHVECSSSVHCLGWRGFANANKKHDYWIQTNAFNNPPSPQAVYVLSTLYMKRLSQLDPPPPQKMRVLRDFDKNKGVQGVFDAFCRGSGGGRQKHEKYPPFFDNLP